MKNFVSVLAVTTALSGLPMASFADTSGTISPVEIASSLPAIPSQPVVSPATNWIGVENINWNVPGLPQAPQVGAGALAPSHSYTVGVDSPVTPVAIAAAGPVGTIVISNPVVSPSGIVAVSSATPPTEAVNIVPAGNIAATGEGQKIPVTANAGTLSVGSTVVESTIVPVNSNNGDVTISTSGTPTKVNQVVVNSGTGAVVIHSDGTVQNAPNSEAASLLGQSAKGPLTGPSVGEVTISSAGALASPAPVIVSSVGSISVSGGTGAISIVGSSGQVVSVTASLPAPTTPPSGNININSATAVQAPSAVAVGTTVSESSAIGGSAAPATGSITVSASSPSIPSSPAVTVNANPVATPNVVVPVGSVAVSANSNYQAAAPVALIGAPIPPQAPTAPLSFLHFNHHLPVAPLAAPAQNIELAVTHPVAASAAIQPIIVVAPASVITNTGTIQSSHH